ncbi:MAG: hypothetical protein WCC46_12630, partial [Terriglobales bacterium]
MEYHTARCKQGGSTLVDDEFVKNLSEIFDSLDRAFRERGTDVEERLKQNLERPEVRAALDDELADLRNMRLRLFRVLAGGSFEDDESIPP